MKRILEIILKRLNKAQKERHDWSGLCHVSWLCYMKEELTHDERAMFKELIIEQSKKQSLFFNIWGLTTNSSMFLWKVNAYAPRKRWLKQQIELHK